MIRVHCTQKLIAKLPLDESGRLRGKKKLGTSHDVTTDGTNETAESPLSNWHANLITLQRRNCVLFVHDATRFPVFVPCLQKADFAGLQQHFTDVFMNTLLKIGADDQTLECAAQDVDFLLWHDNSSITDLLPYSTSVWLAERPCSVKGLKDYIWPVEAMLNLISFHKPHRKEAI
jgi:hypothetical protein